MTALAVVARVFPNDRSAYLYDSDGVLRNGVGSRVHIFEDEDCTTPATLRFYPGGQVVAGGVVQVGVDSLLPEFLESSDQDLLVLWARAEGAEGSYRLDSRLSDRVATIEALSGVIPPRQITYVQQTPSMTWVVRHNLGYLPTTFSVTDSANSPVDAQAADITTDSITLIFAVPISGTAVVS